MARIVIVSLVAIASGSAVVALAAPESHSAVVLPAFQHVDIDLVGDFALRKGAQHGYKITAERKVIDAITFQVKDGKLSVRSARNFKTDQRIRIEINASMLASVRMAGSESVVSEIPTTQTFSIANEGSGSYRGSNVLATHVTVMSSGSGDTELAGKTDSLKVVTGGSGDTLLDRLIATGARVESSGAGSVKVRAERALEAIVSGTGTITYKGNPTLTQRVTGSGDVLKAPASSSAH